MTHCSSIIYALLSSRVRNYFYTVLYQLCSIWVMNMLKFSSLAQLWCKFIRHRLLTDCAVCSVECTGCTVACDISFLAGKLNQVRGLMDCCLYRRVWLMTTSCEGWEHKLAMRDTFSRFRFRASINVATIVERCRCRMKVRGAFLFVNRLWALASFRLFWFTYFVLIFIFDFRKHY